MEKNYPRINHDDEVFALIYKIMTSSLTILKPEYFDIMDKVLHFSITISPEEIYRLTEKMKKSFLEQPALLTLNNDSITVVADLHGQSIHLLRILLICDPPPNQKYLFLGDYVDRGSQSVIVMCLLFCLKHRYPQNVFLLRGNHEDVNTTLNYGFYDECIDQYDDEVGERVWRLFMETFNCMPLAAVVGGKVFCAHGGISPWMESIEDINNIERPLIVPPYGLACDLLWSDPSQPEKNTGWGLSHRGISFTYGRAVIDEFCAKNDISLIIRGHQLFKEMYPTGNVLRFGGRLITLFSALNYEGHKNNSSVLKLDLSTTPIRVKQVIFRCRHYAPLRANEIMACRDMKFQKPQKKKFDGLKSTYLQ